MNQMYLVLGHPNCKETSHRVTPIMISGDPQKALESARKAYEHPHETFISSITIDLIEENNYRDMLEFSKQEETLVFLAFKMPDNTWTERVNKIPISV